MAASPFVLDTSVYIQAFRDSSVELRLQRFLARYGHRVLLAATVAMELRVGARTPALEAALNELIGAYRSRGQFIAASFDGHVEAGRALAALSARERRTGVTAMTNDAVLAATAREADATLVTANVRDFAALRRHLRGFRFEVLDEAM